MKSHRSGPGFACNILESGDVISTPIPLVFRLYGRRLDITVLLLNVRLTHLSIR